jgi:hypothetical protein
MSYDPTIGLKVVCINDKFTEPFVRALYTSLPVEGQTYVIRDVRLGVCAPKWEGDISILLIGLVNPCATSKAGLEYGFKADRFRPLDELPGDKEEKPKKLHRHMFVPTEWTVEEEIVLPCKVAPGIFVDLSEAYGQE